MNFRIKKKMVLAQKRYLSAKFAVKSFPPKEAKIFTKGRLTFPLN